MLLQIVFAAATASAEEGEKRLVRMPITYEKAMLVVVNSEGAGGVRFIDAFEIGNESGNGIIGISYEWRYLERKSHAEQQIGTGRVFAKLVDGAVHHGSFIVTCGPIHITWSHTDKESGSVQYHPREVALHPVAAEYFAVRESPRIEAVDLSRFLYPDEAATKAHGTEGYSGPDSEPRRYNGDTAGPVPYASGVLVAKDAFGIATFKFGQVFERDHSQDQKLHGVSYEFTYTSHDGKSRQAGNGEVYERYTGGKYDGGRLHLEAGPVHLAWSRGSNDLGWVYYDPAWIRVWYVDTAHAESLVNALVHTDLLPESGRR